MDCNVLSAAQSHLRTKEKEGERQTETDTETKGSFISVLHVLYLSGLFSAIPLFFMGHQNSLGLRVCHLKWANDTPLLGRISFLSFFFFFFFSFIFYSLCVCVGGCTRARARACVCVCARARVCVSFYSMCFCPVSFCPEPPKRYWQEREPMLNATLHRQHQKILHADGQRCEPL